MRWRLSNLGLFVIIGLLLLLVGCCMFVAEFTDTDDCSFSPRIEEEPYSPYLDH